MQADMGKPIRSNESSQHRAPAKGQNPLHTFPRKFPVDGDATNLLRTCYGETGVMDFGFKPVRYRRRLAKFQVGPIHRSTKGTKVSPKQF